MSLGHITSTSAPGAHSGTSISFIPDVEIFGDALFDPDWVYQLARSKAYLFRGVKIDWECDIDQPSDTTTPQKQLIHFPRGIEDYLECICDPADLIAKQNCAGMIKFPDLASGRMEWAINWLQNGDGRQIYYCNTIPNVAGGAHEQGVRSAVLRAIKRYAELSDNKRAQNINVDDILASMVAIISIFIPSPSFQGQTKDKLLNQEVAKLVDGVLRDLLDHWLSGNPKTANEILERLISESEARIASKKAREVVRKSPIKSLRLPGKLTDCIKSRASGTELFIVEGASAGGSAKQARNRENQAILPLKGKILNVASNSLEKMKHNQELSDLTTALGCGLGAHYNHSDLRYDKVIIMTDADVDGAHIASLLMTFFFLQMPKLITEGHLYLAQPPLFRICHKQNNIYVHSEAEREKIVTKLSKGRGNIEISRFKGLGEMTAPQLKETTMNPETRILLKVHLPEVHPTQSQLVESLMGRKPELRFQFIRDKSSSLSPNIISELIDA